MKYLHGIVDTSVLIDLRQINPKLLPREPGIATIMLAELSDGPAAATNALERASRMADLQESEHRFDPIEFDAAAARRYGQLAAIVRACGRNPRPRRFDLMIAASASVLGLPLFTRNPRDFAGLEGMLTVVGV